MTDRDAVRDELARADETDGACPANCRCRKYECETCEHKDCGWCPKCHPEVPEWN